MLEIIILLLGYLTAESCTTLTQLVLIKWIAHLRWAIIYQHSLKIKLKALKLAFFSEFLFV